jgi:hypothetical protein
MTDLVQERDPDLILEIARVWKGDFERPLVNHNPVRNDQGVIASPLRFRHSVVVPELVGATFRRHFLDDNRAVIERLSDSRIEQRHDFVDPFFESETAGPTGC